MLGGKGKRAKSPGDDRVLTQQLQPYRIRIGIRMGIDESSCPDTFRDYLRDNGWLELAQYFKDLVVARHLADRIDLRECQLALLIHHEDCPLTDAGDGIAFS
jgi:hypothetical protein